MNKSNWLSLNKLKLNSMNKVLLILLLGVAPYCNSQDSEPIIELPKIGFGLNFNPLSLMDYYSTDFSPSKLLIAYNPTSFLRLEPEIGYMSIKDDNSKESFLAYGAGIFFMGQKGKTNIYGGPRIEFAVDKYTNGSNTSKDGRLIIAPSFGAEYFLGKHFSFGGEFALKFISFKDLDGGQDPDEKYTTTGTSLQLRFYL